ncbi:hypothetical protein JY64_04230 [Neisseria meningitidis]|nr:hypothetical protein JY64_04230 [Neisseria meningitidis]
MFFPLRKPNVADCNLVFTKKQICFFAKPNYLLFGKQMPSEAGFVASDGIAAIPAGGAAVSSRPLPIRGLPEAYSEKNF